MSDARLHPRFLLNAQADVIGAEVVLGRPVADLSLGGCRFAGRAWEEPGTVVQLVVTFPGLGANLPLTGTIVRASERDMGIKFQDLSDEQKWALRKHIREAQKTIMA
jgi:hypothetical protein